jgi:hypothetical protein
MTMIRILQKNKGEMSRKELRDAANQEGVSSPYSSLYSLEKSGKVERDGDVIRLKDDQQDNGGGQK